MLTKPKCVNTQSQLTILYGCNVWGSPVVNNYIYLDQVPENVNTHESVTNILGNYDINSCKRIGKARIGHTRPVLVDIKDINHNFELFSKKKLPPIYGTISVRNYTNGKINPYELVHDEFCKFTLNVSMCVHGSCMKLKAWTW